MILPVYGLLLTTGMLSLAPRKGPLNYGVTTAFSPPESLECLQCVLRGNWYCIQPVGDVLMTRNECGLARELVRDNHTYPVTYFCATAMSDCSRPFNWKYVPTDMITKLDPYLTDGPTFAVLPNTTDAFVASPWMDFLHSLIIDDMTWTRTRSIEVNITKEQFLQMVEDLEELGNAASAENTGHNDVVVVVDDNEGACTSDTRDRNSINYNPKCTSSEEEEDFKRITGVEAANKYWEDNA